MEALFLQGALEYLRWHPKMMLAMGSHVARGAALRVGAGRLQAM